MEGARSILLSITGGSDLSLVEVSEAAKVVGEAAHPDANIIFGANVDEELSDQIWVTVVATRFDGRPSAAAPRRRADDPPHQRRRSRPAAADARRRARHRRPRVPPRLAPAPHERGRRSRPSAHRRGRCRGAARGRQRGRRRGLRGARLLRGREPADRVRRRRLHDGPRASGRDDADRLLRRRARPRRDRAPGRAGPGPGPLRRRDGADVLRRPGLLRRARHRRRAGAGAGALRLDAARRPGRPRRPAGPRGGAGQRRAGLHPRHPRPDPRAAARGPASSTRPAGGRCGEGDVFRFPELAEALERFGAEGRGAVLPRRGRGGAQRLRRRARRHPRPRRPRRLRGDRAAADPGAVPRHRGADQPAALLRRDPDRLLPRPARAPRRAAAAPSSWSRRWSAANDRRGLEFAEALYEEGMEAGFLDPAGLDLAAADLLGSTTHISVLDGDGHVRQRHLLQRLRLRGAGAGHRRDPQQHARRGGPQPARLPPHRARAGGCPR